MASTVSTMARRSQLLAGGALFLAFAGALPVCAQAPGTTTGSTAQPAAGAQAQGPADPAATPSTAEPPSEDIVVTGSRIVRSGFSAPTPVTVLGAERVQQRAITNVADALNELPSFRPLVTPATQ